MFRELNKSIFGDSIDMTQLTSFENFNNVITKTIELLDFFAENALRSPIINIVCDKTYILTGDFLLATSKTLQSIALCCYIGNFSDANMLIRKYRDDLFLYLYIIEASNNVKGLTKEECDNIMQGDITTEKLMDTVTLTMSILSTGTRKDNQDKAIDAWFANEIENGNYIKILDIKNYISYLQKNMLVESCFKKFGFDEKLYKLGRKQNNYTHNNGRNFLTDNITYINNIKYETLLEGIYDDIALITSVFLTIIILIKPDYISSFDYIDYLDAGLTPPDDCQYWVDFRVQEYLNEFITKLHPDLKNYLRENNIYGMKIE